MADFENEETEETQSCITMKMYHPQNIEKQVFRAIPFLCKKKHTTDESLAFGRNSNTCRYALWDERASRVQFVLQVFKHFNSSDVRFEVKNVSKKTKLLVDNMELTYLNRIELPSRCMIRFGDYQFLVEQEPGDSGEKFEIYFELSPTSLLQEVLIAPSLQPIPEHGAENNAPS